MYFLIPFCKMLYFSQKGGSMKLLLLIFTGMTLVACGNAEFGMNNPHLTSPGTSDPVADPGQIEDEKEVIKLTATRYYHPNDSDPAVLDLNENKEISLPAEIEVISGNAGNFYSLLAIDDVICYYKGGSDFSYPLQMGNDTEIAKGQRYHLSFCTLESEGFFGDRLDLQAGDSVVVQDGISLEIHNGDSTETTVVELNIEVL